MSIKKFQFLTEKKFDKKYFNKENVRQNLFRKIKFGKKKIILRTPFRRTALTTVIAHFSSNMKCHTKNI